MRGVREIAIPKPWAGWERNRVVLPCGYYDDEVRRAAAALFAVKSVPKNGRSLEPFWA
jgi:hypothetical protein